MTVSAAAQQPFPCTHCGLCCQHVHLADETRYLDSGDGTCRNYEVSSKSCAIYENRPDICRVVRMHAKHYMRQYTWEEFVSLNRQV